MNILNSSSPIDVQLTSDPQYFTPVAFGTSDIHVGRTRHFTMVHLLMGYPQPATAIVTGRFYLCNPDGTGRSNYLEQSHQFIGGGVVFTNSGDVPSGKVLRFEVRVTTSDQDAVWIVHSVASGLYEAY